MKILNDGTQIEILRTYKNASKNEKKDGTHYDLLKVKYSDGKENIICSSEISS